jgi:hypothetical protein
MGTDKLSRNVGIELNCTLRKIPEEHRYHVIRDGSLKSRIEGSKPQGVTKKSTTAGLDRPRGFQETKAPIFRDNGTGWW